MDVVKAEEKNDVYNEEKIFTYEDLSSMGVVYLVPIKNNDYLIRLPYLWASAIVDNSSDKGLLYWKSMLISQSYEKNPVKYENMKEIRNGYLDLDLLKNDNIKKYIVCVFLNAAGTPLANEKYILIQAPVESLTFLGFNENESANICLKRRERPFDSVDDLIEGLNIGDERLKKLKLDDRVDFALSTNGHP
ncbi:hypothetical protein C1646_766126 [Rhizophagus diaphanus]|nr:hypothetical protein C1646_766126 [Rhizophagus diaphanus] [Rhizophagus sp. MUCL 43196]